jgi:hypothetical protein
VEDVAQPKPVWKRWWMIAVYVLVALWLAQFVLFSKPTDAGQATTPAPAPAPTETAVAPSDIFVGQP